MKRAFTLIELLVVIAIIAILAAILFPVFAQAKDAAKKTATIAHIKQMATAYVMYAGDADDTGPLGTMYYGRRTTWSIGYPMLMVPYPAGWNPDYSDGDPQIQSIENSYWANSINPYVKNIDLTQIAGGPEHWAVSSDAEVQPKKRPGLIGFSYNGLLSNYSLSAVENTSVVPSMWTGYGRSNIKGRAMDLPQLTCDAIQAGQSQECRFNPSGPPNATSNTPPAVRGALVEGEMSTTFGKQIIVAHVDTSARGYPLSLNKGSNNRNIREPWRYYIDKGVGTDLGTRQCSLNGGFLYPCFFRPDADGTREKWSFISD